MQRAAILLFVVGLSALVTWYLTRMAPEHHQFQSEDNGKIASSLAAMLRASMAVISSKQSEINDPSSVTRGSTARGSSPKA
jgi:hypothetical protein